jgi:hypothetical protein
MNVLMNFFKCPYVSALVGHCALNNYASLTIKIILRSPFSNAPLFLHPHTSKKNVNKKTIKICWIAKNLFNIV